jgi:hypothetical protein
LLAVACAVLAAVVVGGAAAAAPAKVVVEGLFNPRGIAVTSLGGLAVAEQGSGEVNVHALGLKYNLAMLPAGEESGPVDVAIGGLGLSFLGETYIVMSGGDGPLFAKLLRVGPVSGVKVVADIGAYQVTDPDPSDQEGIPDESNPNGLALLGGGNVLVTDAANNDLLHIDKHGTITTVARFPVETVLMPDGFPGPPDFPPAGAPIPAEAVPTAVAVGPDGAWYVSELKGFPFAPGSANIWRIEPGTTDTTCPSASCTVHASGFTNVIDLAFGKDGTMYVLEIAKNGLLSAELGGPPVGALWAVKDGTRTELAPGELLFPGGVAVGRHGTLYVTTGAVFGDGAGTVVKVDAG